jgi:hypothetical protein
MRDGRLHSWTKASAANALVGCALTNMSKQWHPVACEAVATYSFKGNVERKEVGFKKGCRLELYEERRGWYRGYVLPRRTHGLIPGNHISITATHGNVDLFSPLGQARRRRCCAAALALLGLRTKAQGTLLHSQPVDIVLMMSRMVLTTRADAIWDMDL